MIFLKRPFLIVVALGLISTASCSLDRSSKDNPQPEANANSPSGNAIDSSKSPNNDIEDLRTNINVPFEPEEVSWRVVANQKTGDRLIAVFRLNASDTAAYVSRLGGNRNSTDVGVENWFPQELKAMSETTGESTISGVSIPVNEFLRAPFAEGNAYLIPDSDYLVVELRSS